MKAPESILLHGYSFDDEPCKNWTTEPLKNGLRGHAIQHEKYIRKDALLEWINEARAIPHENAITRDLAFQEVVNKLNSM